MGNLSQVELVTACSKKRESQKSFMCEQLEVMVLGYAVCGLYRAPFARALGLYCPEQGHTLGWADLPQPPHVWVGVLEQEFPRNGHSFQSSQMHSSQIL